MSADPVAVLVVPAAGDPGETWKPVAGHPRYEVSDLGRVRTRSAILKPRDDGRKLTVGLWLDGHRVVAFVHHLVLAAFGSGPKPWDGAVCRHLDGDYRNNKPNNLAWGSQAENMADMARHGTVARGERNGGGGKLTPDDVRSIRAGGESQRALADRFGVSRRMVQLIQSGRRWAHVE